MKLPPFTLVHWPTTGSPKETQVLQAHLDMIHDVEPELVDSLQSLRPNFRQTLLRSAFPGVSLATGLGDSSMSALALPTAVPMLQSIVQELRRQPQVITVGIWDLGARVGQLPQIIEKLNAVQPVFAFFEVQAAIPAGMISRPDRVAVWMSERVGRPLSETERAEMRNSMIADDFFERGQTICQDLGIDYLVGLTPSMVANESDGESNWDYFSASRGPMVLASTYELRKFAGAAGRPFEVAVGMVIVAQLLVALNYPGLGFHDDSTGCFFDYNEDRQSIVASIKELQIEDKCLQRIKSQYREAAQKMAAALRDYAKGSDT